MGRVKGIHVRRLEDIEIDRLADMHRTRYAACGPDEPVNMVNLLERLDGKTVDLPNGSKATIMFAIPERLPPHVVARTVYVPTERRVIMEFPNETYKRLRQQNWFARTTVPHELAHVKKHLPELVHLTELPHDQIALARAVASHPIREDSEYQAERYAAAFVAPDTGLRYLQRRGELTVFDLMRRFIMSPQSASIRIQDFMQAERERAAPYKKRRR